MDNKSYEYTYNALSPKEKKEIESIRNKYLNTKNEYDKLKSLDKKVTRLPSIISIIMGICGILIFGLGMSMVLEWDIYIWGSIVGIVGFIVMVGAMPVYKAIYNKNKNKYQNEIINISDKLLKED